jgi:diguanylate cyclase (GGDEF)-like protein
VDRNASVSRLLVVDDDPLIGRAVARALAPRGFDVAIAQSALEAVTLFHQINFPVVVTDLKMPGGDGLALIEELRVVSPNTSFVLLTGSAVVGKGKRGGDQSIVSVVPKPWDAEELYTAVSHARDLYEERTTGDLANAQNRVLLIEDQDVDAALIEDLFDDSGFSVRRASRLSEGIDLLRTGSYAAVLTNLTLADARGLDAVTQIARIAPMTATIVLTDVEDDAVAAQAFRNGAQDWLVKGKFGTSELRRAIRFATERKLAEKRVVELAHTDPLTGLSNRTAFMDRLRRSVAHAHRSRKPLAVLYLDLDRFKAINDRYGHAAGDAVLQAFANRLVGAVRPYDTVARLGGDEFAILLDDVAGVSGAEQVAKRIIASMSMPVSLPECGMLVGTSIGVAFHPLTGESVEALLSGADAAMYQSKRRGTNQYTLATKIVSPA